MKFTAAIDEYLADMRSQGRINSPRTERSYYARLLMHADDVANRDPRKTGRADIKRTLRRWDHPNTQANVRAILVSFYDWAMENADGTLNIETLEGVMRCDVGDWLICGVKGELYPCKPDVFAATYEEVRDD